MDKGRNGCKICKCKGWCPWLEYCNVDPISGKIIMSQGDYNILFSYCPCQSCLVQPICVNACFEFEMYAREIYIRAHPDKSAARNVSMDHLLLEFLLE